MNAKNRHQQSKQQGEVQKKNSSGFEVMSKGMNEPYQKKLVCRSHKLNACLCVS